MLGKKCGPASPGGCAQTPLDAVALRRVADLLGDRQSDAGPGGLDRHGLQRERRASGAPAFGRVEELRPLAQPAESLGVRRGRHAARPQAERDLRPTLRRKFRILRPSLVAMRARKPWRRVRTILLGWYVRFIVLHHAGRGPLCSSL